MHGPRALSGTYVRSRQAIPTTGTSAMRIGIRVGAGQLRGSLNSGRRSRRRTYWGRPRPHLPDKRAAAARGNIPAPQCGVQAAAFPLFCWLYVHGSPDWSTEGRVRSSACAFSSDERQPPFNEVNPGWCPKISAFPWNRFVHMSADATPLQLTLSSPPLALALPLCLELFQHACHKVLVFKQAVIRRSAFQLTQILQHKVTARFLEQLCPLTHTFSSKYHLIDVGNAYQQHCRLSTLLSKHRKAVTV